MGPTAETIYLDYNATAPVLPEVTAAVSASLADFGNPSSVHGPGRRARAAVEDAREAVAKMVGVAAAEVIFTSGGTEANDLALSGFAAGMPVLASGIEHPSVLAHVRPEDILPVTGTGVIDLDAMESRLKQNSGPVVVALMMANNETGAIQPVREAAAIAGRYGALLHCDAVQGPGKVAVDFASLGVDSLSLSAHKFGGLKGAGALVVKKGREVTPRLKGGGQERRRRGGTENVPGIVGFGVAASREPALRAQMTRIATLRAKLEKAMTAAAPAGKVFAQEAARLANTTCIALAGVTSESQVMRLDLAGIAVSAGSACSSGKISASHVLSAMGVESPLAKGAIRVSLGWNTTEAEIDRFLAVWQTLASSAAA